ncbi:MAG TPA: hypothetical protein DD723_00400 [Candidatus Omnitrophica bacterium]|nr:MAG: hypothetical protein A2Z81_04670 [Omnitrophica WOR_2 bacterium GWA2_45_18]HBR13991.1 hypothetical protein [Candidatus Omnitrophota bacterium]
MQKLRLVLLGVFCLSLMAPTVVFAVSTSFVVSASIPQATGVSISATKVLSDGNQWGASVTALDFDPMTLDSENGVWLPDHYFAIDVGATGGAGSPDVTVTYVEGAKPTGQTNGLGYKSIATFVKVTGATGNQTETELNAHGPKKLLKDLSGEQITDTEISGGFLRIYVGVFPGDDQDILDADGEPFTNSDKPGDYDGTLTITGTVS